MIRATTVDNQDILLRDVINLTMGRELDVILINLRATDAMRRVISQRNAVRLRTFVTPATSQVTLLGTVLMPRKKYLHPPSCVRRFK